MDVKLINPFIKATFDVIRNMAMVTPKNGKPFLKKEDVAIGDVSSIVGMTGNRNGTISISFEEKCILNIVSKMFGEEMKDLDAEVADAVGELMNMISGQGRKELDIIGYHFDGGIPTVFMGPNHRVIHITEGPKIGVPFTTINGKFALEICMES